MHREGFNSARNSICHFLYVALEQWSCWIGFDPKSTPYAKKLVELQDPNTALDQIYTVNNKSWQRWVFRQERKI